MSTTADDLTTANATPTATATVSAAIASQALAKMKAVRVAQQAWAQTSVAQRAQKLLEAGHALLAEADELAALLSEETGKPLAESYSSEVLGVADLFAYWCKHGPAMLKPRKGLIPKLEMPGKRAQVERVPRGVIVCISPWNYPVSLPMRTIVPALLAGNGVVLKPSEATPRTGTWLVERLRRSLGGVIDILEGDGAAGAALVQALPDQVIFTGSTRTGRRVAVACAERGIVCELELGGKDCAVVLEDCNLERTATGIAWGILTNAGQNCSGIERVAVHSAIAERFLPLLQKAMETAASDVPGLVTPMQRQIVEEHLKAAIAAGGIVLTGGLGEPGKPLPPTLVRDVPADCPAWRQETFGPMAVVAIGRSDEELIALANDTQYGLGASVWSEDLTRAELVAHRVRSGMVWINNHSFTGALPDLPWVGLGDSGTGVTNSPEAIAHMTRPRLVVVDSVRSIEPWWYPYGPAMVELMRTLIARQRTGGLVATWNTLQLLKKRTKELQGHG